VTTKERPLRESEVRSRIKALCQYHIINSGIPWHRTKDWGEQCPLVNPLCPDDLCVLPVNHVGTKEGYHVLGTTSYEFAEWYPASWYRPELRGDRDGLIEKGYEWQQIMETMNVFGGTSLPEAPTT
jgi:hypothetical protein